MTELIKHEYCLYCKKKIDYSVNIRKRKYCFGDCDIKYRYKFLRDKRLNIINSLQSKICEYYFFKDTIFLDRIENYIGCSKEYLFEYIESLFTKGMTWNNHGIRGWHIDHIKLCNSFDLLINSNIRLCFHYSNLRPLWYKDNHSQGKKEIKMIQYNNKNYYISLLFFSFLI